MTPHNGEWFATTHNMIQFGWRTHCLRDILLHPLNFAHFPPDNEIEAERACASSLCAHHSVDCHFTFATGFSLLSSCARDGGRVRSVSAALRLNFGGINSFLRQQWPLSKCSIVVSLALCVSSIFGRNEVREYLAAHQRITRTPLMRSFLWLLFSRSSNSSSSHCSQKRRVFQLMAVLKWAEMDLNGHTARPRPARPRIRMSKWTTI